MKRTKRKLALRSDTIRQLTDTDIRAARGGIITWLSAFLCAPTWQVGCVETDSCTAELDTTAVRPMR